jgi:CheY-like chemotaxis protein
LRAIENARYAACLLYIGLPDLPDLPGTQMASRIRRLRGPYAPFLVAMSSYGQHANVSSALAAAFELFLVKSARASS